MKNEQIWYPIALALLLPILSACGPAPQEDPQNSLLPEETAEKIVVLSWEDYLAPNVVEAFEARTGMPIEVRVFGNTEEMLDQIKSYPGEIDVVISDCATLTTMSELRLIQDLDHKALPNLKHLDFDFLRKGMDHECRHSVPYFWGTTVIAYNSAKLKDVDPTWQTFTRPELKGRIMMYDDKQEVFSSSLLWLGHDGNSENPDDIAEVEHLLTSVIEEQQLTFGNDADVREGLISGEIWAALCYSGDASYIREDNPDIDYFLPREGAALWIDAFAIPRDSGRTMAAHAFIDFLLEPEISAMSTNYYTYASPNLAAREFIDPELLSDKRINPSPEVIEEDLVFMGEFSPAKERQTTKIMRSLLKAAGPAKREAELSQVD